MKTRLAKVTQFAVLSLLLIGIGIASASSAAAQRNRWDGYPNWGGSFQLRETALNAGYNEGTKEGRDDRGRNRYRRYSEFGAYNDATHDYSSRLGDRELYRRYYRLAFERGYDTENPNNYNNRNNDRNGQDNRDRNGQDNRDRNRDRDNNNNNNRRGRDWNRYGQYGGSYQLRQTALNAGYNAGNKYGHDDARQRRRRNLNDISDYRNATTDYSSKLGDRELYRRYYREGFTNGYEDGYNGY
ncbi:MAG TPA: hypothetical protein DC054_19775 [Blastocatellia bacterium]|nr:hypothetical protein [Blastocatellia bacterium]